MGDRRDAREAANLIARARAGLAGQESAAVLRLLEISGLLNHLHVETSN